MWLYRVLFIYCNSAGLLKTAMRRKGKMKIKQTKIKLSLDTGNERKEQIHCNKDLLAFILVYANYISDRRLTHLPPKEWVCPGDGIASDSEVPGKHGVFLH